MGVNLRMCWLTSIYTDSVLSAQIYSSSLLIDLIQTAGCKTKLFGYIQLKYLQYMYIVEFNHNSDSKVLYYLFLIRIQTRKNLIFLENEIKLRNWNRISNLGIFHIFLILMYMLVWCVLCWGLSQTSASVSCVTVRWQSAFIQILMK